MEQDAAPARGDERSSPPGRRRGTARGHYRTPARSSLTCGACKGSGESAARRRKENAAMERRAAQRVSPDALAPKGAIESMWRRSALHPLCVGRRAGREYGRARAVKRIGPAELGCLKFGPVIPARERLGMSEKIIRRYCRSDASCRSWRQPADGSARPCAR